MCCAITRQNASATRCTALTSMTLPASDMQLDRRKVSRLPSVPRWPYVFQLFHTMTFQYPGSPGYPPYAAWPPYPTVTSPRSPHTPSGRRSRGVVVGQKALLGDVPVRPTWNRITGEHGLEINVTPEQSAALGPLVQQYFQQNGQLPNSAQPSQAPRPMQQYPGDGGGGSSGGCCVVS